MTDEEFCNFISNAISHNELSIKFAEDHLTILQSPAWRNSPGAEASIKKFKESLEYHQTAIKHWREKFRERFGYPALNS